MILVSDSRQEKLVLKRERDSYVNDCQYLVLGESGFGKTLATEKLIHCFYSEGYNVIVLRDQKDLLELAWMQFPHSIMFDYQKKALEYEKSPLVQIPVKLYHPFTFQLSKKKIPETTFFTIPIKSLCDSDFNFLLESVEDKATRELLLTTQSQLSNSDNLWDFIKKVESLSEKQIIQKGSKKTLQPDPLKFGTNVALGSMRSMNEIVGTFDKFQRHMCLSSNDCELNLDWNEVFADNRVVKIFSTRFIQDSKLKDFITLVLLNQLVKNYEKNKSKGLVVIFDEIKDLCSSAYKVPYKEILSKELARHLNTNFRIRKISSISTSQALSMINRSLLKANVFNVIFVGHISGTADIDTFRTIYGCTTETINTILHLDKNCFLPLGISEYDLECGTAFRVLMPPFCHAEAGQSYDYLFQKFFPERMFNYSKLLKDMQKIKDNAIKSIMEQPLIKTGGTKE